MPISVCHSLIEVLLRTILELVVLISYLLQEDEQAHRELVIFLLW
jgi:hypothetical protein